MKDVMSVQPRKAAKRGFYIEVGCPGCGGELELGEDFWVIRCKYCGSVLRVQMPGQSTGEMGGTHSELWATSPGQSTGAMGGTHSKLWATRLQASALSHPAAFVVQGRVAQYQVRFGIDRYLKERGEVLTSGEVLFKQVYYPYWKVDAVLLKARNRVEVIAEVKEDGQASSYEPERKIKRTDVSLVPYAITFPAGGAVDGVPYSVGLRATYVKGRPFADEAMQEEYQALPVTVDWAAARKTAIRMVGNVGRIETAEFGKNRTEMFRLRGTVVYFPYWIAESYGGGALRRWIVDAVTGQVAGVAGEGDETRRGAEGEAEMETTERGEIGSEGEEGTEAKVEFGRLTVGMHRCGNCGHDLPEEQSFVYICRHCGQMTTVEEHPLFGGEVAMAAGEAGKEEVLLPFWLLTMTPELAGRLKVLAGGMGRSGVLAVPAFRLSNYEGGYRLGRRMTTAVGQMGSQAIGEEAGRWAPVGVSPSEALVLARVAVARELMGQSSTLELPSGEAFTGMRLFYVPFHKEHYFYVDSITNAVTVEKHLVPSE